MNPFPLLSQLRTGDRVECHYHDRWYPATYERYEPNWEAFVYHCDEDPPNRILRHRNDPFYRAAQRVRLLPGNLNNPQICMRNPDPAIIHILSHSNSLGPYQLLTPSKAQRCFATLQTLSYKGSRKNRKSNRKSRQRLLLALKTQEGFSHVSVRVDDYKIYLAQQKRAFLSAIFQGLSDPKSSIGRAANTLLWDRNVARIWFDMIITKEETNLNQ